MKKTGGQLLFLFHSIGLRSFFVDLSVTPYHNVSHDMQL